LWPYWYIDDLLTVKTGCFLGWTKARTKDQGEYRSSFAKGRLQVERREVRARDSGTLILDEIRRGTPWCPMHAAMMPFPDGLEEWIVHKKPMLRCARPALPDAQEVGSATHGSLPGGNYWETGTLVRTAMMR